MLSLIAPKVKDQDEVGLYHNEGIALLCAKRLQGTYKKGTPRHREKKKQEVSDVFKSSGLMFNK